MPFVFASIEKTWYDITWDLMSCKFELTPSNVDYRCSNSKILRIN